MNLVSFIPPGLRDMVDSIYKSPLIDALFKFSAYKAVKAPLS